MVAGLIIGIVKSSPQNSATYGIIVIYLIGIAEASQWILRQIINLESLMVSA